MVSSTKWHDMDGSPIIVTENVVEYRKAIAEYVTAGVERMLHSLVAWPSCLHVNSNMCS
jgi:hypothetical protein